MNRKPANIVDEGRLSRVGERRFSTIEDVRTIESQDFDSLGLHLIVDFYDCKAIPSTAKTLDAMMLATAQEIKATVVTSSFHEFSPQGLSGVVVIAESHLAAHTWPEHNVVCIDLFTCSNDMNATAGLVFLFQALDAGSMTLSRFSRGNSVR